MEPVVLTQQEQLIVRRLQVETLVAKNKAHEYKTSIEVEYKRLQDDVAAKAKNLMDALAALGTKAGFDPQKLSFNFDTMTLSALPEPESKAEGQ